MYICLPVKQKSNKAFCLSLPAGVTMTKTRDLWHPVTFVCRRLHLWLMSISYPDLCVKEDHKHTHSNRGEPTQYFMSYQRSIFHLLSSPARMLTGIPSWGDGSGTCTHMLRRSLAHPTNTHTHIDTAQGRCLLWLTRRPCCADTSLTLYPFQMRITVYQLLWAKHHVSMCAYLWGMCASSLLPVRHYYTLPSFHFYIGVYSFNQSQTVCVCLPLCLQARMLNARRGLWWVFFLFFGQLFAVVLRLDQGSGGVIVAQWIGTVFKCKFTERRNDRDRE